MDPRQALLRPRGGSTGPAAGVSPVLNSQNPHGRLTFGWLASPAIALDINLSVAFWLREATHALSAQVLLETHSATTAFNLSHAEAESGSAELFCDAPHRCAAVPQLARSLLGRLYSGPG